MLTNHGMIFFYNSLRDETGDRVPLCRTLSSCHLPASSRAMLVSLETFVQHVLVTRHIHRELQNFPANRYLPVWNRWGLCAPGRFLTCSRQAINHFSKSPLNSHRTLLCRLLHLTMKRIVSGYHYFVYDLNNKVRPQCLLVQDALKPEQLLTQPLLKSQTLVGSSHTRCPIISHWHYAGGVYFFGFQTIHNSLTNDLPSCFACKWYQLNDFFLQPIRVHMSVYQLCLLNIVYITWLFTGGWICRSWIDGVNWMSGDCWHFDGLTLAVFTQRDISLTFWTISCTWRPRIDVADILTIISCMHYFSSSSWVWRLDSLLESIFTCSWNVFKHNFLLFTYFSADRWASIVGSEIKWICPRRIKEISSETFLFWNVSMVGSTRVGVGNSISRQKGKGQKR